MDTAAICGLKTECERGEIEVPTVTGVWRTADWHEREIFDMKGIRFREHPDLRAHFDVGRISVFPVAQGFSAGGQAERNCRKWLSPSPRR